MRIERGLQCAAACVAFAVYASLSHYANSTPGAGNLGTALALAPATGLGLVLVRRVSVPLALLAVAGWAGLLIGVWPELRQRFALLALLEECSLYLILGLTFMRSLQHGCTAVCTQLADSLHGPLSTAEVRYTRNVTAAWAIFFFAIATTSAAVFARAPLHSWSVFSNFCVLPLVGAMFVAEYWVRRRVLPDVKRAGILSTVRVYLGTPRSS